MKCPVCDKELFSIINTPNSLLYCGDINHPSYNPVDKKWSNTNDVTKKDNIINPEVFEINKTVEITKTMTLLDLNGTKVNFQSEFLISSKDPSIKYLIAVVNQDELDEGNINFEESIDGQMSKKIIYQENVHKNHFLSIKKHKNDISEEPITLHVVIRLSELPKIEQTILKKNTFLEESDNIVHENFLNRLPQNNLYKKNTNNYYLVFGILCLIIACFIFLKRRNRFY